MLKTLKMDEVSFYYASIKFLKSVLKFTSAMIRKITSDALILTKFTALVVDISYQCKKLCADVKSVFSWNE